MKSLTLALVLLLFAGTARAQYNQMNDIPYREATEGYAKERCKLDVYYSTNTQDARTRNRGGQLSSAAKGSH